MHVRIVKTFVILVSISLGLMMHSACSLNRIVMNAAGGFMESGIQSVYSEGDLELAKNFLSSNLKMIEILATKDTSNARLNLLAAQAFGAYAMAFVEDENPERASALYKRGLVYSFHSLPQKKRFDEQVTIDQLENLLLSCEKNDVPALFWLGYNWGQFILQHLDDPMTIIHLSKVEMIMRRVMELDENYNFAGVDLFYGCFYAARPPFLGGNPEKGKEYFERNNELNGNSFFMSQYFLAKYYAVQIQDRQMFDSLLTEIEQADIDARPDIRLMNALAKEKTTKLRLMEADLFDTGE
ncbi:MAG: TRAP transporter TatT component family protein [Candidatus Marinimicrobia bacterium]|nr:TRAP transporter TatT component family protein [Candidatus Neomarinimicrobiota bacterium]